tara:strand:- start:35 stop:406 length:372 start_codon:yes stop_codon:yes gene_type:complete
MEVINHLKNYQPLSKVQSKYLLGVTHSDESTEVATGKQLWKLQDLANKCRAMAATITRYAEKHKVAVSHSVSTTEVIDELCQVKLPLSKEHASTKIKMLDDMLSKHLVEYSNLVQASITAKEA